MRWHLLTVFTLTSLALAQTAQQPAAPSTSGLVINGGYASTPVQAPTVLTPHVTLGIASPNPVGATSSASGLQVGATSAAIPPAVTQQPIANEAIISNGGVNLGNTRTGIGPVASIAASGPQASAPANGQGADTGGTAGVAPAASQSVDVAAAARFYREHHQRAVKTYTNDDINRLNQQTNTASSGANSALPASDMGAPTAAPTSNPAATTPQNDQTQQAPAAQPPAPETKSKPVPYTPPATPPQ